MRGWAEREAEPAQARPITSDDLMRAALAADAGDDRERLRALGCVDAARWLAWPEERPDAVAFESRLLADPPTGDDAAGRLLRQSIAVRRASRAGELEAGATALEALPAGYSFKSLWLHWRDLLAAAGRTESWPTVRRKLTAALQQRGVPPSETLPALLGELDLPRWRAEVRLAARLAERLAEAVEMQLPRLRSPQAQRWQRAAAGRELVRADAIEAGASLIHAAAEELPKPSGARSAGRLFSHPAPEAALWLRGALERAADQVVSTREPIGFQATLAMIAVARRHRAPHLLAETLCPLPVRFARGDQTAVALLEGAAAWLACGNAWMAAEWYSGGLRQLGRAATGPLATEAAHAAARYVERRAERSALHALADVCRRLSGTAAAELRAELARLLERFDERDLAWQELAAAYRAAWSSYIDSPARVLLACAACHLDWGMVGGGLALVREALLGSLAVPAAPLEAADAEAEARALRELLAAGQAHYDPCALAVWTLLRCNQRGLAVAAWDAADAVVNRLEDAGLRLRGELTIARAVNAGLDVDLRAGVEAAVAEEAARILERLRSDTPPAQRPASS